MKPNPKEKYCYYHMAYHPVEAFAVNRKKPDGLQSECRAAQSERRGKIVQGVVRIAFMAAIFAVIHSVFAGMLAGISGMMPWNWFAESGIDIGDGFDPIPVEPAPIDVPEDIIEQPIEMVDADTPEEYPYRMPDREPDIAVGHGKDWAA